MFLIPVKCRVEVNDKVLGRATIVDNYGHQTSDLVPGEIFTSKNLAGLEVGLYDVAIRVTDKGSKKVEPHFPLDGRPNGIVPVVPVVPVAQSVPVADTSQAADPLSVVTVVSDSSSSLPTDQTTKPLTSLNIDNWCPEKYFVSKEAKLIFRTAYNMLLSDPSAPVKVLFKGESGYGKTTIVEEAAKFLKLDIFRFNCASIRDPLDWYGFNEVKTVIIDGKPSPETNFRHSDLAQVMAKGNVIIILDELNRIEPSLHNSLLPILDDSGETLVQGHNFAVGKNVMFVGTINEGSKYTGTFPLDEAITNRFELTCEVKALPHDEEVKVIRSRYSQIEEEAADLIVKVANILRESEYTCSTRVTLAIAKMFVSGLTLRQAFEFAVTKRIPDLQEYIPERKAVCELLNVTFNEVFE